MSPKVGEDESGIVMQQQSILVLDLSYFSKFKIWMLTTLEKANHCIHLIKQYRFDALRTRVHEQYSTDVIAAPSISTRVHMEAEL